MKAKTTVVLAIAVVLLCGAKPKPGSDFDPNSFPPDMRKDAEHIADAYRKFPDEAAVLYQVAAMHARAGHKQEALAALKRMAAIGAGLDPRSSSFGSLADDLEFKQIKAQIRHDNPPVLSARLAYVIEEGDLMPEGHRLFGEDSQTVSRQHAQDCVGVGRWQEFDPLKILRLSLK